MSAPEQLPLALDAKAPWQITLAKWGHAYRPVRCFQHYTSEHRAERAASHRLGPVPRDQVGRVLLRPPAAPQHRLALALAGTVGNPLDPG